MFYPRKNTESIEYWLTESGSTAALEHKILPDFNRKALNRDNVPVYRRTEKVFNFISNLLQIGPIGVKTIPSRGVA